MPDGFCPKFGATRRLSLLASRGSPLNLPGTPITDVGLQKLDAIPVALCLDLTGTKVTKQGIAELKKRTTILGVDGLN
jgi:hypothetical protein